MVWWEGRQQEARQSNAWGELQVTRKTGQKELPECPEECHQATPKTSPPAQVSHPTACSQSQRTRAVRDSIPEGEEGRGRVGRWLLCMWPLCLTVPTGSIQNEEYMRLRTVLSTARTTEEMLFTSMDEWQEEKKKKKHRISSGGEKAIEGEEPGVPRQQSPHEQRRSRVQLFPRLLPARADAQMLCLARTRLPTTFTAAVHAIRQQLAPRAATRTRTRCAYVA